MNNELGNNHTIHSQHQHMTWDHSREPAIKAAPGDIITFENIDATSGQISADSDIQTISSLDFSLINPIAGPVYVDGAEPGDSLKVTLIDFSPSCWAWTAIVPGFGLLAEDFPNPALNIWNYDHNFAQPAVFSEIARIPLKPFCGTTGVAPAQPGGHSTIPPYMTGGNMDIRDLSLGVDLYLPVQVPGALFSIGDPHCAQGDGEVCGTAIESPMGVTAKLDLVKGDELKFPRFSTSKPVSRHLDGSGYEVATGIGPDLMEASKNAVRGTIEFLSKTKNINPDQAYMLCSVCADLRISEIVDQPNWVVSCYFPNIVFE